MPIRQDTRYLQFPVEPELFDSLGLDPDEDGVPAVRRALERYRGAIDDARRTLGESFAREELGLIADVMNGVWLIGDWMPSFRVHLIANIQDAVWPEGRDGARSHCGFADKWFGDGKGEPRTKALLRKLRRMASIQADALALAVRDFWRDPEAVVGDDWWLPAPDGGARPAGGKR